MKKKLMIMKLAACFAVFAATIPVNLALAGQPVSHAPDPLHARVSARYQAIKAKLAEARKAGTLSGAEAAGIEKKLNWVRTDSATRAKQQGFISAGESASYNRALDDAEQMIHRGTSGARK
ncbi:hypothetical protein [Xanthomonas arboricola]|uniref:hypothetical protein n=1 Tax=Xanthomonas arboricola TaxID=56448 RepID=UPI00137A1CDE|nr:hypothetical protein [Xanthomonas arboricola]